MLRINGIAMCHLSAPLCHLSHIGWQKQLRGVCIVLATMYGSGGEGGRWCICALSILSVLTSPQLCHCSVSLAIIKLIGSCSSTTEYNSPRPVAASTKHILDPY